MLVESAPFVNQDDRSKSLVSCLLHISVSKNGILVRRTWLGAKAFQQKLLEPFSKWPSTTKRGLSSQDTTLVSDQADHPLQKQIISLIWSLVNLNPILKVEMQTFWTLHWTLWLYQHDHQLGCLHCYHYWGVAGDSFDLLNNWTAIYFFLQSHISSWNARQYYQPSMKSFFNIYLFGIMG